MDEATLVSRLAELTGLLSPAQGTPPEALDQARRLLAEALLNGQPESMAGASSSSCTPTGVEGLSPHTLDDLRRIAQDALSAPRDPSIRLFLRTWPLLTGHAGQSVPAWAAGWTPELSLGPFESTEGSLAWFDIRRTATPTLLIDARTGAPLIVLPPEALPAGAPGSAVTAQQLLPGSVWLAVSLFDPSAPVGAFAGLRIRAGTLTLSEPGYVYGTTVHAGPGIVVTLQLELDPPARPPRARHGGDAHRIKAELPEQVTFTLTVGAGGRLAQAGRASLEVYGHRLRLRTLEAAAPRYDSLLARLWFPMSPTPGTLSVDDARSHVFRPSGSAAVEEAAWGLPVALPLGGSPLRLGAVAGAGALALWLAGGLDTALPPVESGAPLRLESMLLLAEPGHLSALAGSRPARYRQVLDLWARRAGGRCQIELQSNAPLRLRFDAGTADGGAEVLTISSLECTARLDRPVTAAGQQVPFTSRRATLDVQRFAGDTRIALTAPADPPRDPVTGAQQAQPAMSFALSNALVRTSAPVGLWLFGRLDEDQVDQGTLLICFALGALLPSLPDPYAANIGRRVPRGRFDPAHAEASRELVGRVQWTAAGLPELSFELGAGQDLPLVPGFLPVEDTPIQRPADRRRDYLLEVEERFPRLTGQEPETFRLLDVSSRADLFGVGYSTYIPDRRGFAGGPEAPLYLRGLDLIAPVQNVSAFILPAFQWEPVYNIPTPGPLSFPAKLMSLTDGGPTRLAMPVASLAPVAPLAVVEALVTEYHRQDGTLAARFTLPFGMVAVAELRRFSGPFALGFEAPRFGTVRPGFPEEGLEGGLQLTLEAPANFFQPFGGLPPSLPGAAVQTDNSTDGINVLKSGAVSLVDDVFNQTFADKIESIPVNRIDFSGYGASTFSDWRRTDDDATGITQVKFEAMVGRTAREVVQIRALLYPWGARVVRIITMERTGSGGVFRRDSGWQAASDAEYALPGCTVHRGVVPRLTRIRRIRDTTHVYEKVDGGETVKLVQVVFDADVEIEGVTLGADDRGRVPTRDIVGYVQVLPVGAQGNIEPLTRDQLKNLLVTTGPIGGPIDCELNVAQSGLHMRLARIEVDHTATQGGNPEFVAVARGTVEMPNAGQWTMAYRGPDDDEPHRLAADRPIPLIRANPAGGGIPPYRFADPRELYHAANPSSEYGLVFSAGAQRLLIPQPQVHWGDATLHSGSALLFADMYALAGIVALFPRADRCHPLPAGSALRITGRKKARLDIPAQPQPLNPGEFKVGSLERTLFHGSALRVRSRFLQNHAAFPDSTIKLVIDSDQDPAWSCSYGPVSLLGDIDDLDELIQVVGQMSSSSHAAPQLLNPQIVFGGPLAPVQKIIEFLTWFGVPFPFDVSVTNAKYGFKSGWKYVFPKYGFVAIEEALKKGPGIMLDVELLGRWGIESDVSEPIEKAFGEHVPVSTHGTSEATMRGWHFGVELTSKVLARTATLGNLVNLWAGGGSKLEIGGEESGKTRISYSWILAGAIELEAGVLSLTGERSLSFGFQHLVGQKQIALTCAMGLEVELEFLQGLAAAAVSFELIALIEPAEDYRVRGTGVVAVDLTFAWAMSKTYEVEVWVEEHITAEHFNPGSLLP